jgi:hypothetical protein
MPDLETQGALASEPCPTCGRRKPGQQPKPTELKERVRTIRVSNQEWSEWQDAARASGLTISAWIKGRCRG